MMTIRCFECSETGHDRVYMNKMCYYYMLLPQDIYIYIWDIWIEFLMSRNDMLMNDVYICYVIKKKKKKPTSASNWYQR